MKQAKFVKEITVIDPDSNLPVDISIYKHENGGMFGIDSSYIEQVLEDDETIISIDPLSMVEITNVPNKYLVELQ